LTRSFHQFKLETEKVRGYTGLNAPLTVDLKNRPGISEKKTVPKTGSLWMTTF